MSRTPWRAVLLVLLAAALFGTLGVLSRGAYELGLGPFAWVAWRAGFGALGLWAVVRWRRGVVSGGSGIRGVDAGARWSLAAAAAAAAGLNLAIFVAFERTSIALALLAFYTYPAITAGAAAALGREPLDRLRLAALGLALGGMVAVVGGGLDPAAGLVADPLGIGLALLAAACQTAFILVSRGYAAVRADSAMAAILLGSAVVAAIVTLASGGPAALALPLGDPALFLMLAGVGLFAAALPSLLFLNGIRRLGAVRAGIVMLFEPVVGVILAAFLLGERATPLQVLGGLTILVAAALAQRRPEAGAGAAPAAVVPAPGGP